MIWDNPILDRMIEKEIFAEIIVRLNPSETAVALLRADGLDDQQIAEALGITRAAVQARIKQAVTRISSQMPEAARLLAGRDRYNSASRHFTIPEQDDLITASHAARMLSCSSQTIRNWITAGRLPNAQQASTGQWLIPWGDLKRLT